MLEALAIAIVLCIFGTVWTVRMVLNPRYWRFWWMRRLGIPDIRFTSAQRTKQAGRLRLVAVLFTLMLVVVAGGGIYLVVQTLTAGDRAKTDFERTEAETRRVINEMGLNK